MKFYLIEVEVYVIYKIKNNGFFEVKFVIWVFFVMVFGGVEVMLILKIDIGFLLSYLLVIWLYIKFNDYRVLWGEDFIILK